MKLAMESVGREESPGQVEEKKLKKKKPKKTKKKGKTLPGGGTKRRTVS